MTKYKSLLLWWFTFSGIWGIYRYFDNSEFFSEVIAKPFIWIGTTALFFSLSLIPREIVDDLKRNWTQNKPIWKIVFLPTLFIIFYFFLINFRQIKAPPFSLMTILFTLIVNFSTGIIEEVTYRGVLYVGLLRITDEIRAFFLTQLLFLLAHIPTLVLYSDSLQAAFSHAFFIVLMGIVHTFIFRLTKSIYSSSLSHGLWNSLVFYFLLS